MRCVILVRELWLELELVGRGRRHEYLMLGRVLSNNVLRLLLLLLLLLHGLLLIIVMLRLLWADDMLLVVASRCGSTSRERVDRLGWSSRAY